MDIDLAVLGDAELAALLAACRVEQHRRAEEAGDPEAIAVTAFATAFSSAVPALPFRQGPYIACPGGTRKANKARTSHECRFVAVGDVWAWGSEACAHDSVYRADDGMRALTLVVPYDGMAVDVVDCKMRAGRHERIAVHSFTVRDGDVVPVRSRAPALGLQFFGRE